MTSRSFCNIRGGLWHPNIVTVRSQIAVQTKRTRATVAGRVVEEVLMVVLTIHMLRVLLFITT